MEYQSLLFVLLLFLGFGLVSRRVDGTMLTPPMLFTGVGLLFGWLFLDMPAFQISDGPLQILLEATLVLVLFSDAARIRLRDLRTGYHLPLRMLWLGIPLTLVVGTAIVYALPVSLTFCETALLVAILTPTDAALGQVVVTSRAVPEQIRQALSVESGLNDGIALPLVLALASLASALATDENMRWLEFALLQLGFGPLAGLLVGYGGARLLQFADNRGWMSPTGYGVMSLVLAGLCYTVAELLHGNGFIAAFVGGLVFGNTLDRPCHFLYEFVEAEGQLLTLGAFFLFGSLFLPEALTASTPVYWLIAVLSLTLLRMLPVWLSLGGLALATDTRLFLGWFGPRGLASLLFISLVVKDTMLPNADTVIHIVFITVFLSIFLHGMSAAPLARLYGLRHATNGHPGEKTT